MGPGGGAQDVARHEVRPGHLHADVAPRLEERGFGGDRRYRWQVQPAEVEGRQGVAREHAARAHREVGGAWAQGRRRARLRQNHEDEGQAGNGRT